MEKLTLDTSVVSVDWLNANKKAPNLIILDASIKKVTNTSGDSTVNVQIPGSRFFDIKLAFSDTSSHFPNTYPSIEQFTKSATTIGISNDSIIVVYDDKGIYSSPRAWWLFKSFGHDNIAILNGGLPAWLDGNYDVETKTEYSGKLGNFEGRLIDNYMCFFKDIQEELAQPKGLIVDARSENRFKGLIKEPRQGLRSGHIPNSINLPFGSLLNDKVLKSKLELMEIFQHINPKQKPMIFSCGSGITACILAFSATVAGYDDLSVYDGSWTEYGSLTNT